MEDVVILGGARTAFGTYGGGFKDVPAVDLATHAARGALERSGVEAGAVDNVVMGNVVLSSNDAIFFARHVGLKVGAPVEVPALTVNRLCGSGLQAIVSAAQSIRLGESRLALAGGAESMSRVPHVTYGLRWGTPLGESLSLQDLLWEGLLDTYGGCSMAITAENLAQDYGISRETCDLYALKSHQRASAARASCRFSQEIVPVTVNTRKGPVTVDKDELIRDDASLENLGKLKARFQENGVVTAGNASGVNDGAAAVVLASESAAAERGAAPLGRIVSWGIAGVEPTRMGIGPVPASKLALERAGLGLADIDLVEINEAFAAQYLAVEQVLDLDPEKSNVNGGAVALGHPLGASGVRLALTVLTELRNRGQRYGLASLCIGGGQGIAVIFEAL